MALRAKAAQSVQQHVQSMPPPSATMAPSGPHPTGVPHSIGGPQPPGVPLGPPFGRYPPGSTPQAGGAGPGGMLVPPSSEPLGGLTFPETMREEGR
jgi:hypothetical protein